MLISNSQSLMLAQQRLQMCLMGAPMPISASVQPTDNKSKIVDSLVKADAKLNDALKHYSANCDAAINMLKGI